MSSEIPITDRKIHTLTGYKVVRNDQFMTGEFKLSKESSSQNTKVPSFRIIVRKLKYGTFRREAKLEWVNSR